VVASQEFSAMVLGLPIDADEPRVGRPVGCAASAGTDESDARAPSVATPPILRGDMPIQRIVTGIGPALTSAGRSLVRALLMGHRRSERSLGDNIHRAFLTELAVRRRMFFVLVLMTTVVGATHLAMVLRIDGFAVHEIAMLSVFVVLFAWIAAAFWVFSFGYLIRKRMVLLDSMVGGGFRQETARTERARSALVMPIYNEDPQRVFAGLAAICESLREAGGLASFDIYVLSDSTDMGKRAAEALHHTRIRDSFGDEARFYYRHRPDNTGRKSGNIADFCRNWGRRYEYMVVLDADSLMTGRTLVELVGLMECNPDTALIQVAPQLVGHDSLFARMQQFASSVYGPIVATGLAALSGPESNYWGHNAIIRVAPFMEHCGLPELPGKPPLGGEILSHDFVEAALLHRAGWRVWLVQDLGGSFEESPPSMVDHLARDRRWCQGNMQHGKLLLARGFRLPSRFNFIVGIMSYVSSPLWLLLLGLTAIEAYNQAGFVPVSYHGTTPVLFWRASSAADLAFLISVTALLLFGPKLLAFLDLRRDPARLAEHGGSVKALSSILLETLVSALFAPISMLAHTRFVVEILLGRSTSWSGQSRDDHLLPLGAVARLFAPYTIAALVATSVAFLAIPDEVVWMLPVLIGLAAAIPLISATSSVHAGVQARRWGLFLTPGETAGIPVVDRVAAMLADDATPRRRRAAGNREPAIARAGNANVSFDGVRGYLASTP
jgi:membrane glycosyltransferase